MMTTDERHKLLDRALTILEIALAHDYAVLHTDDISELASLRNMWVPDAEEIVLQAEEAGRLDVEEFKKRHECDQGQSPPRTEDQGLLPFDDDSGD